MMLLPLFGTEVASLIRDFRGGANRHTCFNYNGPGVDERLAEVELYLLSILA